MLAADVALTRKRVAKLRKYMDREVLSADGFVCAKFAECRKSARTERLTFTQGQLSHVGKFYDLSIGRKPLRVMVVGQEYGASRGLVDLDEQYRQIMRSGRFLRFKADGAHPGRNPHMRGTTSALRLLLGNSLGTDYEGEFVETTAGYVHIFDAFALVNRLLCSAHIRGTSRGAATQRMRDNCLRHFEASVNILQPTVMILQGLNVARWIKPLIEDARAITSHLNEIRIAGQVVLACAFSHPSSQGSTRWGDAKNPYLTAVVLPTIAAARAEVGNGK